MDEPLSNLDARLRIEMRAELKLLHQEIGITTVYVTHDQSEAMGLSDRLAVLNRGRVQQCDAPVAVYNRPSNTFVAGFIGIPAMNIVPAGVANQQPLEIEFAGLRLVLPDRAAVRKKEVLLGIRPEHISLERSASCRSIEASVSVVEPAGSTAWVEVTAHGLKLTAVSKLEMDFKRKERCCLAIAWDRISLFDIDSGERLENAGPEAGISE